MKGKWLLLVFLFPFLLLAEKKDGRWPQVGEVKLPSSSQNAFFLEGDEERPSLGCAAIFEEGFLKKTREKERKEQKPEKAKKAE